MGTKFFLLHYIYLTAAAFLWRLSRCWFCRVFFHIERSIKWPLGIPTGSQMFSRAIFKPREICHFFIEDKQQGNIRPPSREYQDVFAENEQGMEHGEQQMGLLHATKPEPCRFLKNLLIHTVWFPSGKKTTFTFHRLFTLSWQETRTETSRTCHCCVFPEPRTHHSLKRSRPHYFFWEFGFKFINPSIFWLFRRIWNSCCCFFKRI